MNIKKNFGHFLMGVALILLLVLLSGKASVAAFIMFCIAPAIVFAAGMLLTSESTRYLKFIASKKFNYFKKEIIVYAYDQKKSGTFKQIFDSISKNTDELCILRLAESVDENSRDNIIRHLARCNPAIFKNWNLLLFKHGKNFFVASLFFTDDGALTVHTDRFEDNSVWEASIRHRVAVPRQVIWQV